MAQRTVCLCNGKSIGIESIFTIINGKQINIPDKLKYLRTKSQNNELFCPCGCGANLILVAGDKNLREQHFRIKKGTNENDCHAITECETSINSKIVLKCWLDDKLQTGDVETRVPINHIGSTNRKYEFSFLSRSKKIAVSYSYDRVNLSDEKFDILKENSKDIQLIYVVDIKNENDNGQYPERLIKIQDRQGYCLLLSVENATYTDAKMCAVFYAKDNGGMWKEITFADGSLTDFTIDKNGSLLYSNEKLSDLQIAKSKSFNESLQKELKSREEEKKRQEKQKQLQKIIEQKKSDYLKQDLENENERKKQTLDKKYHYEQNQRQETQKQPHETVECENFEYLKQWDEEEIENKLKKQIEEAIIRKEKENAEQVAERKRREADFLKNMADNFTQQDTQVRDADDNRWIKCKFCGNIKKTDEFVSYGGENQLNLGLCKNCSLKQRATKSEVEANAMQVTADTSICPKCGGKLQERSGPYGKFMGCSNYPKCKHTQNIRKKN